ncbi:MAG TPA: acetyl-CoA carboxylase biotin carboxyl carrier protein [Candidatus Omnitrophota bacterium]|nr:acetyl-CoA carboxylase biotin carboxyl carrier protein [Candidatus Omnitrophota bacterium]HQL40871.1 acetyl-CoA carboxylase biotin carboxyl carrier protein [Candidatus Omnitrophota bacterium]
MNLKEIKEIVTLMNENDLMEVEVEREGSKLKIKKGPLGAPVVMSSPAVEYRPSVAAPVPASNQTPEVVRPEAPSGKGLKEIKAPMVGTFYRAPSPDAPSFVDVGQVIEVGQVVCILEAMKLMNEIKSDVRGKVVDIKVDNAEPVEFGTVLFVIEPV